ncbi:MAG TPA: 16S rRNA (adenine(1518)-N(6)/adenine(1519)-N(6))-dimethyltransferase RsmA [Solirubrobacteraceae bacterium]|nr:16S rRNA (adenine(1518)-N(6)/adenine(1519)-N(6))-dimethyltransferase RsmA [Solirubrobacteraceae bacterium]
MRVPARPGFGSGEHPGGRSSARQRELGQNFLADPNILGVIERLAGLSGTDVVLEVGGGLGVLSVRLAPQVAHLHVVEVDGRLKERLRATLAPFPNVSLHMIDAMIIDYRQLEPVPNRMIANLPYGVAAPVILGTIGVLPSLESWVVMVQREVGERFAAAPGTRAYGVPSVIAQLACEVRVLRAVPRTVFRPVPNVDSVLLGLRRHGPGADNALRAIIHGAFRHRRKTLAGSLALAGTMPLPGGGQASGAELRDRARTALEAIGHPADERAERLTPEEFRALFARL